jgi:hypothetical protein
VTEGLHGPRAWAAQALLYGAFALVVGVLANGPSYRHLGPDRAVVKLSFSHSGQRLVACRKLGAEELAKLPPNMRAPTQCPRERAPVVVELDVDGRQVLRKVAPPTGLARDGPSSVYHRVDVPAGEHRVTVRVKDSPGAGGFDHERSTTVTLAPTRILVVDFDAEKGVVWR